MSGCDRPKQLEFGEPFDVSSAVPLSKLLSGETALRSESVIVSGLVGEVCRSAGCWFVLQESVDGKAYEIFTDLKTCASTTISPRLQGRRAVVAGTLVGKEPDRQLRATGLVVR